MIATHLDTSSQFTPKRETRVRAGLVEASLALKVLKCRKKNVKRDLKLALFVADRAINYLADSDAISTAMLQMSWIFAEKDMPEDIKEVGIFVNSWVYEALLIARSREKALGRKLSRDVISFDIPDAAEWN
jgi:hypothetical protein